MNDEQLLRYSRQILLPQFDIEGQQKLLDAHVLIIGAGGLGSPIALYLAAAGVGHIAISDFDKVELSNLQRQIAHSNRDIGRAKVDSARDAMLELNPDIDVRVIDHALQDPELSAEVRSVDLVIDGSDNFATRFAINHACVDTRTPLVSGAVIRMEGQLAVFRPDLDDQPCYHCLYGEGEELAETCSQTGVLAPVAGTVGCLQATEAIKILSGVGEPLNGRMLVIDAATMHFRTLRIPRDPHCPVCGD
ncbi:MAG: molybdopterin-synthase adenylyltransferase MoeB [Gammaproteobacteria bacterium]|nr:molybdopterin-synthase adenylyltransferase MoeB [Gammaproteobacteria bacterium]MCP5136265.1 molybdopterin-synthase adenylyltransferase MoeB [Gammaproteobacteria bacterium]